MRNAPMAIRVILVVGFLFAVEVCAQPTEPAARTINVPEQANVTLAFAAEELSEYFKTITGRDYPVVDKEKKEAALEALREVLSELHENGITSEELEVTKSYSKASFLRDNETKTDRSRNLAVFEALGLSYEFLEKIAAEINAVSLEELNAYIKTIVDPARGIEVVVGPKEEDKAI